MSESSKVSRNEYLLKWSLDLGEGTFDELARKENVTVGSDVEFRALGDWSEIRELTVDGGLETRMKVQLGQGQGQLKVVFETRVESLEQGGAEKRQAMKTFVCSDSGIKPSHGNHWHQNKHVFTSPMSSLGNTKLMSDGLLDTSFSVSLRGCDFGGDGETVTCDLRINEMLLSLLTH